MNTITDDQGNIYDLVAYYDEGCENGCCKSLIGYVLVPAIMTDKELGPKT